MHEHKYYFSPHNELGMLQQPLFILQFPEQGTSLLLCQPFSLQEEFILWPHDSCLPPPHTLLQWEGRQYSPCTFPWGLVAFIQAPSGIYSEYAIWRDSKLQMLFYLKSFFFLLVLWIFFHPWGVTEHSTLAQSWMIYFPWQNQNVLLRVYCGLWNRLGFFSCEDYCPVSLYLHFEFSVVILMTAELKLTLNILSQVKQCPTRLLRFPLKPTNKLNISC